MNNKSCGCSKAMPVRPASRMPKGMMTKPVCDTCKVKDWSCGEEKCSVMNNKQMGSCGCNEACAPSSQRDCCNRCNQPSGRMAEARPCGKIMPEASCGMVMPEARSCAKKMPEESCRMNMHKAARPCVRVMPEAACGMVMSETSPCARRMPEAPYRMVMPAADTCGCSKDWDDNWKEDYMDTIVKKYGQKCNEKNYRKCNNGCEMEFGEAVDVLPIGMGYVPFQEWDCNVSNACQGLYDGTIFPELVKPFVCTYCYEEGSCR